MRSDRLHGVTGLYGVGRMRWRLDGLARRASIEWGEHGNALLRARHPSRFQVSLRDDCRDSSG